MEKHCCNKYIIEIKKGRKKALSENQIKRAEELYWGQGHSFRKIAGFFNVSRMAVWRSLNEKSNSEEMNISGSMNSGIVEGR
ncbi:MAG: helix-turn-helix domain-containing protein [Candidatus Diapherotrites archaeon]